MAFRILLDARHVRDFGYGTYIRNLLRSLAAIDRENEYLLPIHPQNAGELSHLPGNFRPIPYARRDDDWLDHLALPWLVRQLAPDLCHIPLVAVPLAMPGPYVVTVHDLGRLLYETVTGPREAVRAHSMRRGLLRARRVIAVSEATRRDVEALLRIPPSRMRRVYSAPDPQFLQPVPGDGPARRRVLERYGMEHPFLLYAGNIRPQKNIPRLVEAFALVRDHLAGHEAWGSLQLVIIGDELSKHPAVRRAVVQTRLQRQVRFLGFVPIETLRVFYRSAALFVFPSLYEGFGLPPLEAMASGTPVVTSAASSLPEVVGDAAVLVNPENVFDIARGIEEVLLDPGRRAQLVGLGHQQARRFDWGATAREVLAVYHEALTSRP